MSYDYGPITTSATALIAKYGKAYTFTRTTNGAYNPATGQVSQTTETFSKSACVFDYSDRDRAGESILVGDRRMLAESGDYQVGDKVSIDGEVYQVINVDEIAPGGSVVAANLQVRQ